MQQTSVSVKPWPNALDFSLYNARHSCVVKCRERLATLYSEVERVLLCIVKFDRSQIFERCRVLSRAFGHPTIQSRAHARAVAAVFYIIGKSFLVNNIEVLKALHYHWFLLSSSNSEAKWAHWFSEMFNDKSSEKSRAFGHPLSTTLYIARQHYTFIEQCIVKSRERFATLSRQHYTLLDNTIHLSSNV